LCADSCPPPAALPRAIDAQRCALLWLRLRLTSRSQLTIIEPLPSLVGGGRAEVAAAVPHPERVRAECVAALAALAAGSGSGAGWAAVVDGCLHELLAESVAAAQAAPREVPPLFPVAVIWPCLQLPCVTCTDSYCYPRCRASRRCRR